MIYLKQIFTIFIVIYSHLYLCSYLYICICRKNGPAAPLCEPTRLIETSAPPGKDDTWVTRLVPPHITQQYHASPCNATPLPAYHPTMYTLEIYPRLLISGHYNLKCYSSPLMYIIFRLLMIGRWYTQTFILLHCIFSYFKSFLQFYAMFIQIKSP